MSGASSPTLYLIRHGECVHNLERRVAGHSDSPLTERGLLQAQEAGRLLAEIEPRLSEFRFVSSPLHRAAATMEFVRESAGLSPRTYTCDRRLAELDCGDNTFRTWSDIEREIEAMDFEDRWTWQHPSGESLALLYARAAAFLESLADDTVVVTHAGPLRMIRAHYLGLPRGAILDYQPLHAMVVRLTDGTESHLSA